MRISSIVSALVVVLFASSAMAAYEDYNKRYGEYRFGKLPEKGSVSKTVWVGQWWSYKKDGIATRFNGSSGMQDYTPVGEGGDRTKLSPAEKFDIYAGREDKINYEDLKTYIEKSKEIGKDVDGWIEERRDLIYTINRMIEENKDNPDFKWAETEEGKKYQELAEKIDEKKKELADLSVAIDTATEWEVMNHGNGQFGVQYWWGHCNAWAGAACVEPEPAKDVELNGVTFNVGDVKGLLTEAWMECSSSFFGSRNEAHKNEQDRDSIDYNDVTPAAFHIFFADQIGLRDKAFVIDEFTGQEVWNQPVKSYWSKCEPQYEVAEDGTATPEKVAVTLTNYGGWYSQTPEVKQLGEQEVYPVLCTTTIHWMSDGVAHDAVTADYRFDQMTYENYSNGYWVKSNHSDHVAIRTLSYVLWLDKPMTDENASIYGDGEWNHGETWDYAHAHPDFMWQPTANVNQSNRDYENPYIDYDTIANEILPKMLAEHDDPEVEPGTFASQDTPIEIPDGGPGNSLGEAITSTINIESSLAIHEMTVDVDITHTYIGDLQVTLTSPGGKEAILKKFGLGGGDDDIVETYDVKDFNAEELAGTWTLKVVDQWGEDTGTLNSWSLSAK
jgi:subtilisin-like proprotein convertase family protein